MIRWRWHSGGGWYFIGPRALRGTSFFVIGNIGRLEFGVSRVRR